MSTKLSIETAIKSKQLVLQKLLPKQNVFLSLYSLYSIGHQVQRQKRGDLTQFYDKSPYTNRNVKRAKRQYK